MTPGEIKAAIIVLLLIGVGALGYGLYRHGKTVCEGEQAKAANQELVDARQKLADETARADALTRQLNDARQQAAVAAQARRDEVASYAKNHPGFAACQLDPAGLLLWNLDGP